MEENTDSYKVLLGSRTLKPPSKGTAFDTTLQQLSADQGTLTSSTCSVLSIDHIRFDEV